MPPETVTAWLPPIDKEKLFSLNERPDADVLPVCTMTPRFVQSEAVPTLQTVRLAEPGAKPLRVSSVPFAETETTEGAEFESK